MSLPSFLELSIRGRMVNGGNLPLCQGFGPQNPAAPWALDDAGWKAGLSQFMSNHAL